MDVVVIDVLMNGVQGIYLARDKERRCRPFSPQRRKDIKDKQDKHGQH